MVIDGALKITFSLEGDQDWVTYERTDQSKDVLKRVVTAKDIERYTQEWALYVAAKPKEAESGTPLTVLPTVTTESAITLRMKNVRNVEALASLNDYEAGGLGVDGLALRDIAKLYLAAKAPPAQVPQKALEKARAA